MTSRMFSMRIMDHYHGNIKCIVNSQAMRHVRSFRYVVTSKVSFTRESSSNQQPFISAYFKHFNSRSLKHLRGRLAQAVISSYDMQSPQEELMPEQNHSMEFFVTCYPGLEKALVMELTDLGIIHVKESKAGASFWTNNISDGYRACLWLRSAIRVLMLLSRQHLGIEERPQGRYRSGDAVYECTRQAVDWNEVILPGQTFAVDSRLWSCTDLTSSMLASVRIKDAICDSLRDKRGEKPSPPGPGVIADVPLFATLYHDTLSLFRDLSGSSLHRRGYRDAMHKAPLSEAAAAGVLILAGWKQMSSQQGLGNEAMLVDPMCGSGTFLCEAAMMARRMAPGLMRPSKTWPFRRWPDVDQAGLKAAVQEAREAVVSWNGRLIGNDVHTGALSLARRCAFTAGVDNLVTLTNQDCASLVLPGKPSIVVANPPWGVRLGGRGSEDQQDSTSSSYNTASQRGSSATVSRQKPGQSLNLQRRYQPVQDLEEFERVDLDRNGNALPLLQMSVEESWRGLSDFLRGQCGGVTAYVLSGSQEAVNLLRMKPKRKMPLTVGGIETKVYELFVLPPKPSTSGAEIVETIRG
ncbi:hypothetical protein CEUSTIGMA_g11812.t1 [Chlamydomonas eustigma]|uniref:Uncharacterized protein n=1 Tax=Chlamydomonas eustigma TaxID=1157962 RepID=A0A250XNK8_9CHLO|nr:hypothetical protein CEUSTIGMA_g11812.t1 [Chlamydomonas eustigma]|eukprot:GAX84390.1 hypothetical protein CEUSTIGMA_g11812.t1 [Chlamydomonas eustigma]